MFFKRLPVYVVFLLTAQIAVASNTMVFTYRAPQQKGDERKNYQIALLQLILEKTKDEFGDYKLVPSGSMNISRAIETLKNRSRENYFLRLSYSNEYPDFMEYIPFPIDLGVVGHRICFISPEAKKKLSAEPDLNELLALSHVQGKQWVDGDVLRHAGFSVEEISNYEGKFRMVANNRYDLFCRGINEIYHEFEQFSYISGLDYDKTFMLVYPLPRFFYTHRQNSEAIARVKKGIMLAYEDGSLLKLWNNTYRAYVEAAYKEKRVIIHLENPRLEGVNFNYQQYFYKPKSTLAN